METEMEFPVDTRNIKFIVTGDIKPVLVYGTNEPKVDKDGKQLFKIPVLMSGTGGRQDPLTTITLAGNIPAIPNGSIITVTDLMANAWTMKGRDGQYRSGVSFSAKSVALASKGI